MDEKVELIKNPRGLKLRILVGAIAVVAIGLIVSCFFWFFVDMKAGTERFFVILTWLGLIGFWLFSSVTQWYSWQRSRYTLGEDALIVSKGKVVGGSKHYYRYDSILDVKVEMNKLGMNGDFGDVWVNIPKLHRRIVLHDIDQPDKQVKRLKRVIAGSGETKALVY
jgi:hypothetical protein